MLNIHDKAYVVVSLNSTNRELTGSFMLMLSSDHEVLF